MNRDEYWLGIEDGFYSNHLFNRIRYKFRQLIFASNAFLMNKIAKTND